MILYWTLFLSLLSAGVLPAPSRPGTKRLSRGPAWTANLDKLVVSQDDIREAVEERKQRRRVAVIADPRSAGMAEVAASIAAEVIRSGVRYGNRLIVVDGLTSETLFGLAVDAKQIQEVARKNDVDLVFVIRIDEPGRRMAIRVVSSKQDESKAIEPISLENTNEFVIDQAVKARRTLLAAIAALPTAHDRQLDLRPQADFAAMQHFIQAKRMLASVIDIDDDKDRKIRYQKALESIDDSIKTSPDFLEAYVLKASCYDELGSKKQLQDTLITATQKSNLNKHDLLTRQEVQADNARFVQANGVEAMEAYQGLLEVDPTNLTGLWAIIDILLTGDGKSPADSATIAVAETYAAQLLAFHPQSGVAGKLSRAAR